SKLRQIAESCDADLDAFSRWVGRNPDSPRTIAAIALLPAELAMTQTSDEAGGLWAWINKTLGPHDRVVCKTDDILQHCASFGSGKLAKSEAVLLAQLLEKGGYGIEPDVRFGGSPLAPGGTAVIFKLPANAAPIASPQYAGATVLLRLAVAVSAADGSISPAEEKHLEEHMRRSLTLSGSEQVRLSAHLSWLMQARPSLTQVRKRLEALDATQRKTIAEFMIGIAGADGQISPEEIRTLGKIYPMLGFAADEVYSHVHAMSAGVGIDVEGVGKPEPSGGYSIPGRPGPSEPVRLDMAAVKKKVAESAQISAILDDIFTEDEQPQIAATQAASQLPAGKVPAMHGALLSRLVERSEWSRADFERVASECKLLPDGAIDTLNEAAFEVAGVPLIEGDDPMHIDSATAKELLA
ncbi:MAG: TerB family tellurite resistance protein, partial [Acidobacteria bacterium]|nr:TerB family tellurite resistance protein [Acidobacteriota bacterium]